MVEQNAFVTVFLTHAEADACIVKLHNSGFDMKCLSVIAKEAASDGEAVGYYTTAGRMNHWGRLEAFWNGTWSKLSDAGFFWIPGIGDLLVGGPLTNWTVAALQNAPIFGGLSAPGAALYSIGIPKTAVLKCESALREGKHLVVVHGAAADVLRARGIIEGARTMDAGA